MLRSMTDGRPAQLTFPEPTADQAAALARYEAACRRLDEGLIRPELTGVEPERSPRKWAARMEELRSFFAACGDPQRAYPAVHVTGTSGKGSVSTFVAEALRAAGYRVGLHVSPFLQSQTEKIWVDGALIGPEELADLVDWVWPIAAPRKTLDNPASIHGMASVAIAYEAFRRAEVEVAVIEAGCGGRFDLTNALDKVVATITTVGLDHVQTLGPGLADIAWHKAGIMEPGRPAVTGATGEALEVIRREARALGVELREVPAESGPFWEANARVATATLEALRGAFEVGPEHVARAREAARLPARRELVPEAGRTVIVDGAHNPDKMGALAATLPEGCVVVMGCLAAKSHTGIVEALRPKARAVVATEPRVYGKPATPAADLAATCRAAGLEAHAEPDPDAAVDRGLALASPAETVVLTGSLYLVGQLRDRWYPTEQVVLQRTCWPEPAA